MVILGIDPGTATTGFGAIKELNGKIIFLGCGCIRTFPSDSPEVRLNQIFNQINQLIKEYKPSVLAVEKLFFFKNAKTLIPVSQSKGIILLAAARKKIPVYEFTPLQVKMNIVGYGRADKKQVQEMIKVLLKLKDDAADALGLAISYSYLPKKPKIAKNT